MNSTATGRSVSCSGVSVAEHADTIGPNGMTAKDTKHIAAAMIGASDEDDLVGGLGDDVFLQRQLDAVGEGLQQAERAGAVGAGPLLHPADDPALEPDHEQRR